MPSIGQIIGQPLRLLPSRQIQPFFSPFIIQRFLFQDGSGKLALFSWFRHLLMLTFIVMGQRFQHKATQISLAPPPHCYSYLHDVLKKIDGEKLEKNVSFIHTDRRWTYSK